MRSLGSNPRLDRCWVGPASANAGSRESPRSSLVSPSPLYNVEIQHLCSCCPLATFFYMYHSMTTLDEKRTKYYFDPEGHAEIWDNTVRSAAHRPSSPATWAPTCKLPNWLNLGENKRAFHTAKVLVYITLETYKKCLATWQYYRSLIVVELVTWKYDWNIIPPLLSESAQHISRL